MMSRSNTHPGNVLFNPVLIAGCIIILVSFAIRSSFGIFQIPIAEEFNWLRADFSLPSLFRTCSGGSASRCLVRLRKSTATGRRLLPVL